MRSTFSFIAFLILSISNAAHAAVPASMSYQGYLTDATGAAVDGITPVTFSIYNIDTGGSPLWSDTLDVNVESGLFSVLLADGGNAFPSDLFDAPLWVGIAVDGDTEMTPRRALTTAAFSFKADDADKLQGQGPAAFDQSGDVAGLDARLTEVEANQAPTSLECVWSFCMDTPVAGGATCASRVPGYPILGGIDVAIDPNQKPSGCSGTNHEDEMRLYCCRLPQP